MQTGMNKNDFRTMSKRIKSLLSEIAFILIKAGDEETLLNRSKYYFVK